MAPMFEKLKDPNLRAWAERQPPEWRERWGDAHPDLIERQYADSMACSAIAATTPDDGAFAGLTMEQCSELLNAQEAERRAAEAAAGEQG